ncbi:competence type IV pilus major pilin ComGC [Halobacillus amylolyticus]|uniref:ComG operon protein 3 n=1 Tax=Halobacillus amylolyticus TaxID=2932259 RepID=A0ABY4HBR2_9BACI|nr:competence type IV pilus major pilin ComGC [Halobacillus amylolyticus]UOR12323.1 prepilin-type N-terminal cleavage/methylation domain-containing protein [Halobacillus amylolyticus]
MNNQKGFTLIEMLIVLLIISVLLIITIPNLTENNKTIRSKGCEALTLTAEAQVEAYKIENGTFPASLDTLVTGNFLKQTTCPNGKELVYNTTTGAVTSPASE